MSSYVDRIKPDALGITTYLESLRRGQYQIPTFQREVVWDRDRVKRLWDSIYKFYPLGSILVWRTDTKLQLHREIGGHLLGNGPAGREFQYLLDGQQRTTALLTSMYGGKPDKVGRNPLLFVNLTVEDAEEVEDDSFRERFLFWDEIDDRGGTLLRNRGRKKRYDEGLIVKLEDIAHSYQKLEERLHRSGYLYGALEWNQLRSFRQVLDNYKISFIELRGIEVTEVCQIFERINQAGQPLSMFDIVVAKTFRPKKNGSSGFYLRGMLDAYRHELDAQGSQYAAVDNTTMLQMLAVFVRDVRPEAGVHNITDRYLNALRTRHLEEVWDEGQVAIRKVFDFLDSHARLRGPALIPYRYFYMTLASYFFRNGSPDYEFLWRYFWYVCFHDQDLLGNTTQLRDHISRLHRVREGEDFGFGRFLIDKDKLRVASYTYRGRRARALLALFANQDPRDWAYPQRSVLTPVYYMLTDHPNLHHIFPQDFCEKHLDKHQGRYANSLLNIAYLTQITNLRISNKNPLEYMQDYIGPQYPEIERTHLLPGLLAEWAEREEMPKDALERFIEARLDLVLSRLQDYLAGIPFEIIDTLSAAAIGIESQATDHSEVPEGARPASE